MLWIIEQFTYIYDKQIYARISHTNSLAFYSYVAKINKFYLFFISIALICGEKLNFLGSLGIIFWDKGSFIFWIIRLGPSVYIRLSLFL